jgi:hypothetical protein
VAPVTPTTLELRACSPGEGEQLVAGLGLLAAPLSQDDWFAAHAVAEDEALRVLLLGRIAACAGAADPAATLLARHATLILDAVLEAAGRLGAVPTLDGAQVRFSALGLPIALALSPTGWTTGDDRPALHALATERIAAHLAVLEDALA